MLELAPSPAKIIEWKPISANDNGERLPWPVVQVDPDTILESYGQTSARAIFLDGFRCLQGDDSLKDVVWCGFPAINVLKAATFGRRRFAHAVTTEDMEHPNLLSHNPACFAYRQGLTAVPGVVALRRELLYRNHLTNRTTYLTKIGLSFDDTVAGVLIIKK